MPETQTSVIVMHTAMYAAMGQKLAEKMAAADVAMTWS
jgi:hypothetical protein